MNTNFANIPIPSVTDGADRGWQARQGFDNAFGRSHARGTRGVHSARAFGVATRRTLFIFMCLFVGNICMSQAQPIETNIPGHLSDFGWADGIITNLPARPNQTIEITADRNVYQAEDTKSARVTFTASNDVTIVETQMEPTNFLFHSNYTGTIQVGTNYTSVEELDRILRASNMVKKQIEEWHKINRVRVQTLNRAVPEAGVP